MFSCSTSLIGYLYRLLKALSLVSSRVLLRISPQGIKISADSSSRACQAHLFLANKLFTVYEADFDSEVYADGVATVSVSLSAFVECLHLFAEFGDSTTDKENEVNAPNKLPSLCRFIYKGTGTPFVILLKRGPNLVTQCELKTFQDPDGSETDITLALDLIVAKMIIKGSIMDDAIKELGSIGTNVLSIRCSSHVPPHLSFVSQGLIGTSKIVFPHDKSLLESFSVATPETGDSNQVTNTLIVNNYLYDLIYLARDAIQMASKVSLRCDVNGVMSLQSMCDASEGRQSFIDFRYLPLV